MAKVNLDLPAAKRKNRPHDFDFDKQLVERLERLAKIVKDEIRRWKELRRQREEINRFIIAHDRRITALEEQFDPLC